MSPPRAKAIVRPSGEKFGSVSVGFSVSWLRRPSLTANSPPLATPSTVEDFEKTTAPVLDAAEAAAGTTRASSANIAIRVFLNIRLLLSRAVGDCVHRCSGLEPCRPTTAAPPTGPRMARCGSAGAVEAQLDDASGDLPWAVAAAVAGDVELGGEGVEAALGGALGDVELGGDLGPGRGTAGEGPLA